VLFYVYYSILFFEKHFTNTVFLIVIIVIIIIIVLLFPCNAESQMCIAKYISASELFTGPSQSSGVDRKP